MTYNIWTNERYSFDIIMITNGIHSILSPIESSQTTINKKNKKTARGIDASQCEKLCANIWFKIWVHDKITKCQIMNTWVPLHGKYRKKMENRSLIKKKVMAYMGTMNYV